MSNDPHKHRRKMTTIKGNQDKNWLDIHPGDINTIIIYTCRTRQERLEGTESKGKQAHIPLCDGGGTPRSRHGNPCIL